MLKYKVWQLRNKCHLLLSVQLLVAAFIAVPLKSRAQGTPVKVLTPDSTVQDPTCKTLFSRPLTGSLFVGVPLIAGGFVMKQQDAKLSRSLPEPLSRQHAGIDNVLQWTPAITLVALKAAGVPSRSSWRELAVGGALSAALTVATSEAVKRSVKQLRPDASDRRSFASGHTATAFMTATLLAREYGSLSPWITVGAYTTATATGLLRIRHHRHWPSDVMTGAGIGIVGAELGTSIAHLLVGGREKAVGDDIASETPSAIGIYSVFTLPVGRYSLSGGHTLRTSTGIRTGVDGAFYWNKYIGVGGNLSFSRVNYRVDDQETSDDPLRSTVVGAGPCFSWPFAKYWRLEGSFMGQYVWRSESNPDGEAGVRTEAARGLGMSVRAGLGFYVGQRVEVSLKAGYSREPGFGWGSGAFRTFAVGAATAVRL